MTTVRPKKVKPHLTTKTAVGYIRVSTRHQIEEGESVEVQRNRITAYCVSAGLDLVKIIQEPEPISGKTALRSRVGGSELLDMIAKREVAHVVALKLDRLFRSSLDCMTHCEAWHEAGIALHLVDMGGESLNSSGPSGRMFLTILAGFSEFERGLISERTEAALRSKRESGRVYSGTVPYGFTREKDTLSLNADEQTVITLMNRMRKAKKSYGEIAEKLNEKKIRTRNGKTWHASTVMNITKSKRSTLLEAAPLTPQGKKGTSK